MGSSHESTVREILDDIHAGSERIASAIRALCAHLDAEERTGGMLDQVELTTSDHSGVDQLRRDHAELRDGCARVSQALRQAETELVGRVLEHERREAELITKAAYTEFGGSE